MPQVQQCNQYAHSGCRNWKQEGELRMYYSFKIIRIRILELLHKIGQNFSFSKTNFCLLLPISRPHKLWFMLYANNICGNFQVQFITVLLKHSSNNIWFLDIVRKVFLIEITLKFHRNFNRHHCTRTVYCALCSAIVLLGTYIIHTLPALCSCNLWIFNFWIDLD